MGLFSFFKRKKKSSVSDVKSIPKSIDVEVKYKRKYDKQYFDIIELDNVKNYYDTTIELYKKTISLDLNLEDKSISEKELNIINIFIDRLKEFDKKNRGYIKKDFNSELGISAEYIDFYLYDLNFAYFDKNLESENTNEERIIHLFEQMELIRVGISPQGEYFATFDYSINIEGEDSNQLLVVNVKENGDLDYISWES